MATPHASCLSVPVHVQVQVHVLSLSLSCPRHSLLAPFGCILPRLPLAPCCRSRGTPAWLLMITVTRCPPTSLPQNTSNNKSNNNNNALGPSSAAGLAYLTSPTPKPHNTPHSPLRDTQHHKLQHHHQPLLKSRLGPSPTGPPCPAPGVSLAFEAHS